MEPGAALPPARGDLGQPAALEDKVAAEQRAHLGEDGGVVDKALERRLVGVGVAHLAPVLVKLGGGRRQLRRSFLTLQQKRQIQ